MKDKFPLTHVTWYAKDWYKSSGDTMNDIYNDLRVCLTADGYSGEYFKNEDISTMLLRRCEENIKSTSFLPSEVIIETKPQNAWKSGYVYQEMPQARNCDIQDKWNMTDAVTMYCLSQLRFIEGKYCDSNNPPNNSVLPFRNDIATKMVNQFFKK